MQADILEKHPDAKLKVYAIWFNMIRTDSRWMRQKFWLDDPRVIHFWDEEKVAGRFYAENVTHQGGEVEWDAFFLYGPEASWGESLPEPLTWGRPIRNEKQRLLEALSPFLE